MKEKNNVVPIQKPEPPKCIYCDARDGDPDDWVGYHITAEIRVKPRAEFSGALVCSHCFHRYSSGDLTDG
jgi:hypothetical protein